MGIKTRPPSIKQGKHASDMCFLEVRFDCIYLQVHLEWKHCKIWIESITVFVSSPIVKDEWTNFEKDKHPT